jgi:hypothetical protein
VLEDDASFGPLEHWPGALTDMLRSLPKDWSVVNAAPSNINEVSAALQEFSQPSHSPNVFRGNQIEGSIFGWDIDYGT